jgi:hypothetical protein
MEAGSVASRAFTVFQKVTLAEINLLRTSPREYAESRLRDDRRAGRDNGAYQDLVGRTSVPPLRLDRRLCEAAQAYAEYLARRDRWGHCADRTPTERAHAVGYTAYGGENVAAGSSLILNAVVDPIRSARLFVLRLSINEGVPDVGHRLNMLRDSYRVIGVGFARNPDSTYHNYTVQDFGLRQGGSAATEVAAGGSRQSHCRGVAASRQCLRVTAGRSVPRKSGDPTRPEWGDYR